MNTIKAIPDKLSEFNLLTDGTQLAGNVTNLLKNVAKIRKNGGVDRILLECAWTEIMKKMIDIGNAFVLQNFRLDLILEDNN